MADAVAVAVEAAGHLGDVDAAGVQALYEAALRVDERKSGDNVSLPTALKLIDGLGLTPGARGELPGRGKVISGGGDSGAGDAGGDGSAQPSSLELKRRQIRERLGASG